jgi:hypothetical protein
MIASPVVTAISTAISPTASDAGVSGRPYLTISPGREVMTNADLDIMAADTVMTSSTTVSGSLILAIISPRPAPGAPTVSVKSP